MSTSYNGWWASPDLPLRPLVVAGESFIPGILDNDDVFTVLQYVAEQMHERVEPIVRSDWHDADDWGWHYKVSTGDSSVLSCHSSGTAIDYNATRHPYGVSTRANFSEGQIAEIHKILFEVGCVVWGGDWNTPDAMHFEINGNAAEVKAAADRIRNKSEEDDMSQYLEQLNRIETVVNNSADREKKILEKLEGARERQIVTNRLLRETRTQIEALRDEFEPDSAVRRKLDRIIESMPVESSE